MLGLLLILRHFRLPGKKANVDNVQGDLSKCETCGKLGNFGKKKRRFCNPNCAKNKKVGPTGVELNGTVTKVLNDKI